MSVYSNIPGGLVRVQILMQCIRGGAQYSPFLASSQEMVMAVIHTTLSSKVAENQENQESQCNSTLSTLGGILFSVGRNSSVNVKP